MYKFLLVPLFLVVLFAGSVSSAYAQEQVDAFVDLEALSARFSENAPVSVKYDTNISRVQLSVDLTNHPDLAAWEEQSRYPRKPFSFVVEKDGVHIGEFPSYRSYMLDVEDGAYAVDLKYGEVDETYSTQWYDRVSFTIDASTHVNPDDYTVTVRQSVISGAGEDFTGTYHYATSATGYSAGPSVRITGTGEDTFRALQSYGSGYPAYYIPEFTLNLLDTRFSESGFDLYERRNNGWKVESITGENCTDGTYQAGPGLNTECNFAYSYASPYPDVIAANTDDMHIVKTVIVEGGDKTAKEISEAYIYGSRISSFYGGELSTGDIDGDAHRTVGRVVTGCGKTSCGYGGTTGKFSVPTIPRLRHFSERHELLG